MVIIVFGLPGSGKSYFASRLAKSMHAVYLNSDRIRKEMFEQRTYSPREKKAVYGQMLLGLRKALKQRKNVVLDATFHKTVTRELFIKEMAGKGAIRFIEVRAAESIIRERLRKERPDSEADLPVYQRICLAYEPLAEPHLVLKSTNENIDAMLLKAAEYLKKTNDNSADQ